MSVIRRVLRPALLVLCAAALLGSSCGGKSMPESAAGVASVAGPLLGPIMATIPGLSEAQAILGAARCWGSPTRRCRMPSSTR